MPDADVARLVRADVVEVERHVADEIERVARRYGPQTMLP
jgi:hypothetical protein